MKRNFVCLALCFILSALAILCYRFYQTQNQSVFAFAGEEQKTVYLTFDDGPTDSSTPFVLDALKECGVKATFFLIGRQAELRPALTRRIAREGHAIGIHSYTHNYAEIYKSKTALLNDIERCRQTVFDITGVSPSIYRFPGGSFTVKKELVGCVTTAGYTYYDWNASCRDAELPRATPEELFSYAKETSAGKRTVILLCHDFAHRKNTVKALPAIIAYYKEKGYRFDTLS